MNNRVDFFNQSFIDSDKEMVSILKKEEMRQQNNVELIASENIVSRGVLEALSNVFTNKYAEGYIGRRYYEGCMHVDEMEALASERLRKIFNCEYVNIQPHSGAQANLSVVFALLRPQDKIMGLRLDCGGHLTHGAAVTLSGKWFSSVQYGLDKDSLLLDYDEIEKMAVEHEPKLLICGYSSYSRVVDFERFRRIADKVGAYLMADIAHIAGLVAGGEHPSPFPHAHVVTSTTHKTLRGARGGIVMTQHEDIAKKLNSAVFPGTQGGPLLNHLAAKAVSFGEALKPEFKVYAKNVVNNCQYLCEALLKNGIPVITGGSDNHLCVIDTTQYKVTGRMLAGSLDNAGITCNKNAIPYDTNPPAKSSGIRLGTPATTTRGFSKNEYEHIAKWIAQLTQQISVEQQPNPQLESTIKKQVTELCHEFPIYSYKIA